MSSSEHERQRVVARAASGSVQAVASGGECCWQRGWLCVVAVAVSAASSIAQQKPFGLVLYALDYSEAEVELGGDVGERSEEDRRFCMRNSDSLRSEIVDSRTVALLASVCKGRLR